MPRPCFWSPPSPSPCCGDAGAASADLRGPAANTPWSAAGQRHRESDSLRSRTRERGAPPQTCSSMPIGKIYPQLLEQSHQCRAAVAGRTRKRKTISRPGQRADGRRQGRDHRGRFCRIARATQITEASCSQAYDQYAKARRKAKKSMHAISSSRREQEAKDIIDQLNKGADFANLGEGQDDRPAG